MTAKKQFIVAEGSRVYHVLAADRTRAAACGLQGYRPQSGEPTKWLSGTATPRIVTARPNKRRLCKTCRRALLAAATRKNQRCA